MYQIKKGFELPKKFKIKVTPEQSEALQKHLFSLGYTWANGVPIVESTESRFLYTYPNLKFSRTSLDSWVYFEQHVNPEIQFDFYFEKVTTDKWAIFVDESNVVSLSYWINKATQGNKVYSRSSLLHNYLVFPESSGSNCWSYIPAGYVKITMSEWFAKYPPKSAGCSLEPVGALSDCCLGYPIEHYQQAAAVWKERAESFRKQTKNDEKTIVNLRLEIAQLKEKFSRVNDLADQVLNLIKTL